MAGNRVISAVLTLKDKDFGTTAQKSASAMKDLERKTKHSGNTIKDFGKSATSSFKSVATGAASIAAAIGITKGLSMAFNMVKSSVTSAFERIDTMESFERTLTILTGSTEKTKAALEATRNAVTGTGYGLDTAAKSVQNFVTRGMEVDKATKTMEIWGDAVAFYGNGSSEQFETVSDAIGKIYSSGKVGADQLNRLTDVGINGAKMYADATGKSVSSVEKDLSKGNINAEKFLGTIQKAMNEGTGSVQKIAGAAKEAGASWGNTFANMRSAVTRGVESIIKKIDEMLTSNGLPDMRTLVSQFGSKFESVLGGVADKIPAVTGYLVGMYEAAQPTLSWISDTALPAVKEGFDSALDGVKGVYDFISGNLGTIVPIVAGVTASVAAFKTGVVAIAAAKRAWAVATSVVTVATGLLNGTLALTPFGWIVIAIGAVVAAGIALYMNWDTVKEKAQSLWDKTKIVGTGIKTAFTGAFDRVKTAGASAIDFVIGKVNALIDKINNIPFVNIPNIPTATSGAAPATKRGGPQESYAVGTNRVREDMVAQIHKDEMIIPATQSHNLRRQGVTIDNIDKGGLARPAPVRVASDTAAPSNNQLDSNLLMQLIQAIKNMPKGDVYVQIDGHNKSVTEIVNELIPLLKLRLANM